MNKDDGLNLFEPFLFACPLVLFATEESKETHKPI